MAELKSHTVSHQHCQRYRGETDTVCMTFEGEDPFLAGIMATNFCIGECLPFSLSRNKTLTPAWTTGLQENDTQACLKHLVCNDSDTSRREYDVEVDDQTFREIYLRPFEMVIEKANPLAVMTAYNSVVSEV